MEVITLQFGSFANYVGAHYWNFQDELLGLQEGEDTREAASQIDMSTVYRAGETLQGEVTYTPRLVLLDLKGNLGGIGSRGTLYVDGGLPTAQAGISTWAGHAEVHRAQPVPKSSFTLQLEEEGEEEEEELGGLAGQAAAAAASARASALDAAARQLDSAGGVHYFTDYLKAHMHPRSLHQLEGVWAGVAEFGGWGDGAHHAGGGEERREELMEGIRFFAEECDSLQGFQCLVDDLSGFGQIATDVLQEVRDDYGNRPVVLFAVRREAAPDPLLPHASQRRLRLNNALSHALLSQCCDTYAALAPPPEHSALPALRWQAGNPYHSAAIIAAGVDSATLPYRLASNLGSAGAAGGLHMTSLTQLLTSQHATPLVALSLALPCPPAPADMQQEQQRADVRVEQRGGGGRSAEVAEAVAAASAGPPFTSSMAACLAPGLTFPEAAGEAYAESVVLRGARAAGGAVLAPDAAGAAFDVALLREGVRCVRQRAVVSQPLPVPLPYPHIFGPAVSVWGVPGTAPPRPAGATVASCPMLTRLAATRRFGRAMRGLLQQFEGAASTAQGQATLEAWGFGREEVGEARERLTQLAAAYDIEDALL